MTPEFAYLLKVNVAFVLFYAFYRLFFYKDTFFKLRRAILLAFFGLALFYPLLNIQDWVRQQEPIADVIYMYSAMLPEATAKADAAASVDWYGWLLGSLGFIYWGIVAFLCGRFLVQLSSILWLAHTSERVVIHETPVYALRKAAGPFSFFRMVFLHPESHSDKETDEIFVKDNPARKIGVYDLLGNYKRSFKFTDTSYYNYIFNYDRDHLICYKSYPSEKGKRECHLIISKQDGRITHEIQIPSKGIETPVVTEGEFVITPEFYLTFPDRDKWILVNTSSDTIFHYLPDGNLSPFIVRSPSISSMDTKVFLFPTVITDRYCFMRTMRKEVDFTTFKGFLGEDLVYDKQENALFSYILYNDDFINKEEVSLTSEPRNPEIAICQTLDAPDLVEAYEKGQLKGKLKEIAANLSEESNPVVMLLKKKK